MKRAPLFWLLAVVLAPAVVATALYLSGWRPQGSVSHGELLQPPVPVGEMLLNNAKDRWTLVYWLPATCERTCVATLYGLRMAQLAQGKDSHRVQRLLLGDMPERLQVLAQQDKALQVRIGSAQQHAEWLRRVGGQRVGGQTDEGAVWLMDPLGNVILRYPIGADPNGIRKDLTRLLTHSWVG